MSGFTPYMLVIALNALVDLGHKIAIQNTIFTSFDGHQLVLLTSVVNAFILLPFVCFFSAAGFISDTVSKTKVLQISAVCSLVLTVIITLSYYQGWFVFAFFCTLLLATQSAFFSPAKYGLIRELFGKHNIIAGNGIVQALTICAILLSSLLFSIAFEFFLQGNETSANTVLISIAPIGFLLIGCALLETAVSFLLPQLSPATQQRFSVRRYLTFDYLQTNLKRVHSDRSLLYVMIALAFFWGISQVVIAVFGGYIKDTFAITSVIQVQAILALAALGMVVGSLLFARGGRTHTHVEYALLGSLWIAVSLVAIASVQHVVLFAAIFFCYGAAAAYIIVPLNAYIQKRASIEHLGSTLAASNFYQNLFMFVALSITATIAWYQFSAYTIVWLVTAFVILCVIYGIYKLPQAIMRFVFVSLLQMFLKVRAVGLTEQTQEHTQGTLLLGNHVSFLDWAIVQLAYKKPVRFVMEKAYYNKWYLRPIFCAFGVIAISQSGSKDALLAIQTALNEGETVALFPEGYLTRTGHVAQFKTGFMRALSGTDAQVIPFYIDGAWETHFSHAGGLLAQTKNRSFAVYCGEPLDSATTATEVRQKVLELCSDAWHVRAQKTTITHAWIQRKHTKRRFFAADSTGVRLSFSKHMALACTLAGALKKPLANEQYAAVLLPNSAGTTAVGLGSLLLGKTLFPLNYTSNVTHLIDALACLNVTTLVTSQLFIKRLANKNVDITPLLATTQVIYLEDIRANISKIRFLANWVAALCLPAFVMQWLYAYPAKPNDVAVVLASSGSENAPKIIQLTHANIVSNATQAEHLLKPTTNDVIIGTLPIFHAFGTTACFLLPMIARLPVIYHPDPTDALGVAKLTATHKGTVLFGTNTFFRLYVRNTRVHPLMFASVRLAVAGAEKLQETVRTSLQLRFGIDVYEGYGVTEASPVIAVNAPDVLDTTYWYAQQASKQGTIGQALIGSLARILHPESKQICAVNEAGMLVVAGPQIMQGYFGDPEKTDSVIIKMDGRDWYMTGDRCTMDEQGFITIIDRYSRFAKIGGEMVSLGEVETAIAKHLDESVELCALAVADVKKGERIVLLYAGVDKQQVLQAITNANLIALATPSVLQQVDIIPKLGSGKTDFHSAKALVDEGKF